MSERDDQYLIAISSLPSHRVNDASFDPTRNPYGVKRHDTLNYLRAYLILTIRLCITLRRDVAAFRGKLF